MNILYIHGFASEYDPKSAKVECLRKLGTVTGVTVDYTQGYDSVRAVILDAILSNSIDLVVGTSMGGYMASHVSAGIPFVALNPSVSPSASLSKYLGGFVDYSGKTGRLTDDVVSSYPDFSTAAVGLILLDSADTVIDAGNTQAQLCSHYPVHMYEGGSHRFEHMEQALPLISEFYHSVSNTLGSEEN